MGKQEGVGGGRRHVKKCAFGYEVQNKFGIKNNIKLFQHAHLVVAIKVWIRWRDLQHQITIIVM